LFLQKFFVSKYNIYITELFHICKLVCWTAGMESKPGKSPVACSGWQCRTVTHSVRAKRRCTSSC